MIDFRLVMYNFQQQYQEDPRQALAQLETLLSDEQALLARFAFLKSVCPAPQPPAGQELSAEDIREANDLICNQGLLRAYQQGVLTEQRLQLLGRFSRNPDALWQAHRLLQDLPPAPIPWPGEIFLAEARWLREHGQLADAAAKLNRAELTCDNEEVSFDCLAERARLHREMGEFEVAAAEFGDLLQWLEEKEPGFGRGVKVTCCNNLAWLARKRGNLEEAQFYLDQAQHFAGEHAGKFARQLTETDHQRAVVWMLLSSQVQGGAALLENASKLIDKVIEARQEIDSVECLNVARSLVIKAAILERKKLSAEALRISNEALKIRVDAFGEAHGDVADSLFRIADLHKLQGQWDTAIATYEKAIAAYQKSASTELGKIAMARCHARLAEVYTVLQQPKHARDHANAGLQIPNRLRECDAESFNTLVRCSGTN